MNVCGQPNALQIRSHDSKLGERAPALELPVLASTHAESPRRLPHRPARSFPVLLEHHREPWPSTLPPSAQEGAVGRLWF
ncbi:MAG: hypothetical protein K0R20_2616 [Actinomycetia bacterium]|nr:hypothetical protein [Actinomycetes bacterium]